MRTERCKIKSNHINIQTNINKQVKKWAKNVQISSFGDNYFTKYNVLVF